MSLLTINSNNPDLSYILAKNPETIKSTQTPFKRSIRKGNVYGWFSDGNQTFSLYFVDSPSENSFSDSQFEYLDKTRYSSPYAPIAIVANTLASALAKPNDLDTEGFTTSVCCTIKIPARIISRIEKMPCLNLVAVEIAPGHHKVCLSANGVMKALNLFQTVCFIACMSDDDTYVPLPKEAISKFVKSLNRIDAPYYLRHLVASRAINNRDLFIAMKEDLDTDNVRLQFGDTQVQRHDAIRDKLPGGEKLVDIGCGELYHSLRLSKTYESIFAIDANEDLVISNTRRVAHKKLDDQITVLHANVDSAWVEENEGMLEDADVLLGECIEHMPKDSAIEFLKSLMQSSAARIVITVPNKSFNVNYNMEENEFRHPDHLWEPINKEWIEFVQEVKKACPERNVNTYQVGDIVGMEGVSAMAVFEAKQIKE